MATAYSAKRNLPMIAAERERKKEGRTTGRERKGEPR